MKPTLRTWENEWVTASVPRGPHRHPTYTFFLSLPFTLGPPPTPTDDDGAAAGSSIQVGEKFTSPQGCGTRGTRAGLRALVNAERPDRVSSTSPNAGLEERSSPEEKGREAQAMMGPMVWASRLVPPLYLWRDTLEYGDPLRGSSNPTGRDAATETPSDRGSRI